MLSPQDTSLRPRLLRGLICLCLLLGLAAPASALLLSEFGEGGAAGEDGESVELSGSLVVSGADPAELIGVAFGGRGGSAPEGGAAGDGGAVALGPLYAASDTGDVSVEGSAVGGGGGFAMLEDAAGSGASVLLHDAVDGDTAGALELFQNATGGSAGIGVGGQAGRAVSMLRRSKSAESLELRTRAIGGGAPRAPRGSLGNIDGASARATTHGVNAAGSLRVISAARGGEAGSSFTDGAGAGGDASAFAFARSEGDGHAVEVGATQVVSAPLGGVGVGYRVPDVRDRYADIFDPDYAGNIGCDLPDGCCTSCEAAAPLAPSLELPPIVFPPFAPFPFAGALGGLGGGFLSTFLPPISPPAGDGGKARSVSIGIAAGDSPVEVLDAAMGGAGGFQVGVAEGGPSEGGAAHSVALGVGVGSSPVKATAQATGGASGSVAQSLVLPEDPGFFAPGDGLPGGRGDASAVAIGQGQAVAKAVAMAGLGTASLAADRRHPGGVGKALAKAIGHSGSATARAGSSSGKLQVQASAHALVGESATAEATVGAPHRGSTWMGLLRRLGRSRSGRDGFVEATVAPTARDVQHSLRWQRQLEQALDDAGVETIEAIGRYSGRQPRDTPTPLSTPRGTQLPPGVARGTLGLDVELSSVFQGLGSRTGPVFIGLFAPRISAVGFAGLHVLLTNGDEVLIDEFFSSRTQAERFLDGAVLEVGEIGSGLGNPFPPNPNVPTATLSIGLNRPGTGAELSFDFLVGTAPPDDTGGYAIPVVPEP